MVQAVIQIRKLKVTAGGIYVEGRNLRILLNKKTLRLSVPEKLLEVRPFCRFLHGNEPDRHAFVVHAGGVKILQLFIDRFQGFGAVPGIIEAFVLIRGFLRISGRGEK